MEKDFDRTLKSDGEGAPTRNAVELDLTEIAALGHDGFLDWSSGREAISHLDLDVEPRIPVGISVPGTFATRANLTGPGFPSSEAEGDLGTPVTSVYWTFYSGHTTLGVADEDDDLL